MSGRHRQAAITQLGRVRTILGVVVIALSVAAILALVVQKGASRENAVLLAFFAAASYAGVQLVRASAKNERAHQDKLARLARDASDRPGGADAPDERRD
jgi:hypothetical protein